MKITRCGHSCLLIEAGGARVLIDPGNFSTGWQGFSQLDAVLITHRHPDHADPDELPAFMADHPDLPLFAEQGVIDDLGLSDGTAMLPGQSLSFGDLQVNTVGGLHAVIHPDIPRIKNIGLVFSAPGDPTLFHPGDAIDTAPDGIDVLAVPMHAPWEKVGETIDFVRAVGARQAIPIHDGLLNDRGYTMIAGHLGRQTSTEFVSVREPDSWSPSAQA